ncbi:FHA domain-containing protein [Planctomonas sp. JC2975]|uniref:FHA domain-containing protein n=1 Tax=Planctomonas sp. JC2975 TaxID=2729626 RepID=UPI001F0FC85E|nr:FHA domain-containing protein [Planctomonas sp. JC2975]
MSTAQPNDRSTGIGTTHAGWGAGEPRLLVSGGDRRFVFDLDEDGIRIGSAADCDLRLEGLDALHAHIRHDDRDEYLLSLVGAGETTVAPEISDAPADETILRTGARFVLGQWTFVFQREEFADHGRPFGGREGGEGDVQQGQPPRPDYDLGQHS